MIFVKRLSRSRRGIARFSKRGWSVGLRSNERVAVLYCFRCATSKDMLSKTGFSPILWWKSLFKIRSQHLQMRTKPSKKTGKVYRATEMSSTKPDWIQTNTVKRIKLNKRMYLGHMLHSLQWNVGEIWRNWSAKKQIFQFCLMLFISKIRLLRFLALILVQVTFSFNFSNSRFNKIFRMFI